MRNEKPPEKYVYGWTIKKEEQKKFTVKRMPFYVKNIINENYFTRFDGRGGMVLHNNPAKSTPHETFEAAANIIKSIKAAYKNNHDGLPILSNDLRGQPYSEEFKVVFNDGVSEWKKNKTL